MSYKVVLPYDPVWEPLEWAKEHCPSYITNDAVDGKMVSVRGGWVNSYNIVYYFSNEADATIFALKWS